MTSSTDGFYFSDIEEFKKAKTRAGQLSNNDSTSPLFEKDTELVDSDDGNKVSIAKINLKKVIQLQEKEQKCKEKTDETQGTGECEMTDKQECKMTDKQDVNKEDETELKEQKQNKDGVNEITAT